MATARADFQVFTLYLEFRISNPDTLEKVVDRFSLG
jgi:hypothetical protein